MDWTQGGALLVVSLTLALMSVWSPAEHAGRESTVLVQEHQTTYALLDKSTLRSPDGVHPVFRRADPASRLAQEATRLLEESYAREALVLHQYVKNYLARQAGGDRTAAAEPTYVLLSPGTGYAELGFWLQDAHGELIDKRTASYVGGLTIDAGYLGDFEQLFPHELGHVMLQELAGWQEVMVCAQIHQVTMMTDYVYAFNEGWAEHFQTVAVDRTANPHLRSQRAQPLLVGEQGPYARLARESKSGCTLCPARLSLVFWLGQRESHLRYAGVKSNLFARQPPIPEVLLARSDQHDALLYQAIVPPDGSDPIKNGSQMLASEGVTAALFYRLVNDPRLQHTYRQPAFYEQFLPLGETANWAQTSPQELFTPMENVYLKLFHTIGRHVRLDADPLDQSPTIQMMQGYAADYPDEAEALYDAFLQITQGATVESNALQVVADWTAGRLTQAEHRAYLEDLRRRLVAGQVELDSALGPQIWLRNPDVLVGIGVMDVYRSVPRPYHFNLNAATEADLRTVPGVGVDLARRIVKVREEQGSCNSIEELAGVAGMTPEILDHFRSMQRDMQAWLNAGLGDPEDGSALGTLLWSLLSRVLLGLILTCAMAGLVLAGGTWLQAASAKHLRLEVGSAKPDHAQRRARKITGQIGRALGMVVLPVTVFFLVQVLLLASGGGQVTWVAFAVAVWIFGILPTLGWRIVRGRLSSRTALHSAGWFLLIYVAMFGVVGWLMGT